MVPVHAPAEHWLFTFLCAVMDSERSLIFGVGDGLWRADGEGAVLDAGPENAPDYVAYRLVSVEGRQGAPVVHYSGAARTLAISTDGLATQSPELELFCSEPQAWRNPAALQRRLNVMAYVHSRISSYV